VDVCAYSPKDYTKLAITTRQTRKLQKKSCEDPSDWYKRIENNGWRLLSPRVRKDKLFSLCLSMLKKQEMIKRRKRRKIEWLKKMYFGKSLQVQTADPAATVLIQRATEGLISTLENEGIDKVMEWEVDEMLKWTNALNYEEYVKQWKEIGTSKLSDSYQGKNPDYCWQICVIFLEYKHYINFGLHGNHTWKE
uniref:Uncharacterized protein n=1 Tax=Varanus komodoensis TaxID=61221 RepID=A0A8D2ILJ2_VARKO